MYINADRACGNVRKKLKGKLALFETHFSSAVRYEIALLEMHFPLNDVSCPPILKTESGQNKKEDYAHAQTQVNDSIG